MGALGGPPLATLGSSFLSPSLLHPERVEHPNAQSQTYPVPPRLGEQNLATCIRGSWLWVGSQFSPSSEGKFLLLRNTFFSKINKFKKSSGKS